MSSSSEDDEPELETLDISNDNYYIPTAEREASKLRRQERQRIHDEILIRKLNQYGGTGSINVPKYGSRTIRHSMPAYDLWRPFFPTYCSEDKFRNFHRPKLRHYNTGPQKPFCGSPREFSVKSLTRHMIKEQKRLQFKVINAINSGVTRETIVSELLCINKAKDLSAKSGELYFFEYCEEHPPVLSQIGMASNIKTYTLSLAQEKLRKPPENITLSQVACTSSTHLMEMKPNIVGLQENISAASSAKRIYFSQPKPDAAFKVIENNLYRAPIFRHEFSNCDFLVIRTRNSFYVRPVKTIFAVGQTMPLVALPPPTENNIQKFRCDLSNVHIHRLFKESETEPPSLVIDKLSKLFPDYHITVLRRRLRINGAELAKSLKHKSDDVYLQGTSNYGCLSPLEVRRTLLPEQYCLHMSTLAARQRLRELNYSESMIIPTNEAELETEVLAAPWNTSRAILNTMAGKNYLDLRRHLIDPTGLACEGFSCVSWSRSPTEEQQVKDMKITPAEGTFKFQDKNPLAHKIRTEKLERLEIYRNEAEMLTTVQAKMLASDGAISSSEDEVDDQEDSENMMDSDLEKQLRDLDRLVVDRRTVGELNFENEEEERRKLLVEMRINGSAGQDISQDQSNNQQQSQSRVSSTSQANLPFNLEAIQNKILMITRTYKTPTGEIQRTEIVREPRIIALYVKKKGGSLNSSQTPYNVIQEATDDDLNADNSILSTRSDSNLPHRPRSRSTSLGPSELCRADGVTLTISKKVLQNMRPSRRCRRQSVVN